MNLLSLTIGFVTIAGVGVLIDRWFYGEWTLTTWNYFDQNILHNKVAGFGLEPWWWYFKISVENAIPPFSFLFVGGFFILLFFKPKSPIIWSIVPFVLIHSIIGHKELRFLFPIIGFLPYIIVKTIEVIQVKFKLALSENKAMDIFMRLFIIVNTGALLVVMFKPADSHIPLYSLIYNKYKEPTTLYYIDNNPYLRVVDIHYYKRQDLELIPIKSIDKIPLNKKCLLILNHKNNTNSRLVKNTYATYPDWVLKFNINNWVERANGWYLYELN